MASVDTLFRQSKYSAEELLGAAKDAIDKEFGDSYARKNPQLVLYAGRAGRLRHSCFAKQRRNRLVGDIGNSGKADRLL